FSRGRYDLGERSPGMRHGGWPMRICLFEQKPETLEPLSLTRPVFDLVCGITTLGDKQRLHFGSSDWGALLRPGLINLQRLRRPGVPTNDASWLQAGPLVLVNGRWLPPFAKASLPDGPCVALADGHVAYVVVNEDHVRQ